MEKIYIVPSIPNLITIGLMVFIIWAFGGTLVASVKKFTGQ